MEEAIEIRGAREHNLRGVDLVLPRHQLIVFTGVSGSGKSSLAFDTLYAEGQRRYIESLSSYARQFLDQLRKPDVDHVSGLSPAISIEQKTGGANPRSTVGTVTEIQDYLRVLFARVGRSHCPKCQQPIGVQTAEQIVERLMAFPGGATLLVLAPIVRGQKGTFKDLFEDLVRRGYVRARVDGEIHRLAEQELHLTKNKKHDIEVVVDRVTLAPDQRERITEAARQALRLADGYLMAAIDGNPSQELILSARNACAQCNLSFPPLSPQLFSFNSQQGMCRDCEGLGEFETIDPAKMVADDALSINQGALTTIGVIAGARSRLAALVRAVAASLGVSLDTPWRSLPRAARDVILFGPGDEPLAYPQSAKGGPRESPLPWHGLVRDARRAYKQSARHRKFLQPYVGLVTCHDCGGARLNPQARAVRLGGKTIIEVGAMPINDLADFLEHTLPGSLNDVERLIARELLKEIRARVGFLSNVGLDYVSLDRKAPTLSGGEMQRIRLAAQIGSGLVGVLYVLDEPSIGLHPRDNAKLLQSLERLRDQGNTVLVVEHDEDTMRAADYIVDFGPGPGVRGGHVVAAGGLADVMAHPESLTGQYLSGAKAIAVPEKRRPVDPASTPSAEQLRAEALADADQPATVGPRRRRKPMLAPITGDDLSDELLAETETMARTLEDETRRPARKKKRS